MSIAVLLRPLIRALVLLLTNGVGALFQGFRFLVRFSVAQVQHALNNPRLAALLACSLVTFVYVSFLYIWRGLPRDHPSTIKRRLLSAAAACAVSWVPMAVSLQHPPLEQVTPHHPATLAAALGLPATPRLPAELLATLLHTAVLFSLPITFKLTQEGFLVWATARHWLQQLLQAMRQGNSGAAARLLVAPFSDEHLKTWRNLVAAPVTEEFVFRACMAPLLLRAGFSPVFTVFVTPLFFGSAHMHHLRELVVYNRMKLMPAVIVVLVQFTYTTVFGWYATWLFLVTDSLWCPVAAHALCNWVQVPDFKGMARQFGQWVTLLGTGASILVYSWPFTSIPLE